MSRTARRVIVVMLLAVVLYGGLGLYFGVEKIAQSLEHYAWWTFAAACGLAFFNYVLRFLKWEYYLSVLGIRGVPKGESFLTFLSGFVLTVTPGKVGEVFKSLILFQLRRVPVERTAPIVVAERVTDLIGVIVLISIGSINFKGGLAWASIGTAIVVTLLVLVAWPSLTTAILDRLPGLPGALGRVAHRIVPKLEEALRGLRELTTPRRLVWPTILSICAWTSEGIALWVILGGFNEHPPLPVTAFIYATATLAGALIPVPGGLGVTEALLQQQMAHVAAVPTATALAAMLLVRFATLWFAVAVGFVALAILRATRPWLAADEEATATVAIEPAGASLASVSGAPKADSGNAGAETP